MCVSYWPSAIAEPSVCGQYQVELSEEEKDRIGYITRRFKLSPVDNVRGHHWYIHTFTQALNEVVHVHHPSLMTITSMGKNFG